MEAEKKPIVPETLGVWKKEGGEDILLCNRHFLEKKEALGLKPTGILIPNPPESTECVECAAEKLRR